MSKVSVEEKLRSVSNVSIDKGTFKYIQISISLKDHQKIIIRGSTRADYHADVLDECSPSLEALGFTAECIGGGRIMHNPAEKTISVYGYSMGFGRADHKITVALLKDVYPDYNISWSDEGY